MSALQARYFHGGVPGLRSGDLIEPQPFDRGAHLVDGCPVCEARRSGTPSDYDRNHRFDRVYVTTVRFIAKCFAAGYPNGALYRVEPLGDLEADPEHPDSFAVQAARVLAKIDGYVVMSRSELRGMARLSVGWDQMTPTERALNWRAVQL